MCTALLVGSSTSHDRNRRQRQEILTHFGSTPELDIAAVDFACRTPQASHARNGCTRLTVVFQRAHPHKSGEPLLFSGAARSVSRLRQRSQRWASGLLLDEDNSLLITAMPSCPSYPSWLSRYLRGFTDLLPGWLRFYTPLHPSRGQHRQSMHVTSKGSRRASWEVPRKNYPGIRGLHS